MNNALKIIDVYDLDDQDGQFKRLITARNKCKKSFIEKYPKGFFDQGYIESSRSAPAAAHRLWIAELNKQKFGALLQQARYLDIARLAIEIESETVLLNKDEKAALRQALSTASSARAFALGLYQFLHSTDSDQKKFETFCQMLEALSSHAAERSTWPVVTVFSALAQPRRYIFVKPIVTRQAALKYGFPFEYHAAPSWTAYSSMFDFAACLRADLSDLRPRDLIDIQAFITDLGT